MRRPRILLISKGVTEASGTSWNWLSDCDLLGHGESVREAMDRISGVPDWFVLLQNHPGEFSLKDFHLIEQTWPLARTLMVCGDWCDSDGRTGRLPPGVIRVRSRDLPAFFWHWISKPSIPRTANEADHFLAGALDQDRQQIGHVVVQALTRFDCEVLSDAVASLGYTPSPASTTDERGRSSYEAVVWDCQLGSEAEWQAIAAYRCRHSLPVILLLGFARPEDDARAKELGITVLAKPFRLVQLGAALARTVNEQNATTPIHSGQAEA